MNLPMIFAAVCVMIVLALDVTATIRLVRSNSFTTGQKIAQILFLWLLPIIGFVYVWHFLNEVELPKVTTDVRTWLESDDIARHLSNVNREEHSHGGEFGDSQ